MKDINDYIKEAIEHMSIQADKQYDELFLRGLKSLSDKKKKKIRNWVFKELRKQKVSFKIKKIKVEGLTNYKIMEVFKK